VPVPTYRMPDVHKRSAGYHAAPDMDAVDLFVGSEGTLGIVTQVTFRDPPARAVSALALIPCASEPQALALVGPCATRRSHTWRTEDPDGIDAAAIEHMDAGRSQILREDGAGRAQRRLASLAGHGARAARPARTARHHPRGAGVRRHRVRAERGGARFRSSGSAACWTPPDCST
jgi:FAD/FMN-containing dehydrogenase